MATYSELMNLTLPDRTDKYKIEDFNENFRTIDNKITEVQAATAALVTTAKSDLLTLISAHQKQLDTLRYNDYIQLIKQKYIGSVGNVKGYWFDLCHGNTEHDINLTPQGFRIENSLIKMWWRTQTVQMGTNNNYELTLERINEDNPDSFEIRVPKIYDVPNGTAAITLYARGRDNASHINWGMSLTDGNSVSSGGTVRLNHTEYREYHFYINSRSTSKSQLIFRVTSDVSGPVYFQRENSSGDITCTKGGQLVGKMAFQNVLNTSDYLYFKDRVTPESFNKITLYMRSKQGAGEGIIPEVSLNSGAVWRGFGTPIVTETVNNVNQPCIESRFVLDNLPVSSSFKLRFNFRRTDTSVSPEMYDFCIFYE